MGKDTSAPLTGAIRVDEQQIRGHIDEAVRSSVEETLNALLDAEAHAICGAQRSERTPAGWIRGPGHYERKLETKAGEIKLRLPKLQSLRFETLGIRHVHPAVLAAPQVITRLREPVLTTQLLQRDAFIRLPQESDDLFHSESLLHVASCLGLQGRSLDSA